MGKDKKPSDAKDLADQAGALVEGMAEEVALPESITSEDFLFVSMKKPKKRSTLPSSQKTSTHPDEISDIGSSENKCDVEDHTSFYTNGSEFHTSLLSRNGGDSAEGSAVHVFSSFGDSNTERPLNPWPTGTQAMGYRIIEDSYDPIRANVHATDHDSENNPNCSYSNSQSRRRLRKRLQNCKNCNNIKDDCSNVNVNISSNANPIAKNDKNSKKKINKRKQDEEEVELILKELNLMDEKRCDRNAKKAHTGKVKTAKEVHDLSERMENTVPEASKAIKNSKKKSNSNLKLEEKAELPLQELNVMVKVKQDDKNDEVRTVELETPTLEDRTVSDCLENDSQSEGKVLENNENHAVNTASHKKKAKLEKQKSLEKCVNDDLISADKDTIPIEVTKNVSVPKKDKKKPSKKQLAIILDSLKKAKEEEEKLKKEEEAKQKALEEAERLRQEKLRLEEERKEKKKRNKKARLDKMRAEGKLLSKSQKLSRARMEATLIALRQQGIEVPMIGEKIPPRTRVDSFKRSDRRKRLNSQYSTDDSSTVSSTRHKTVSSSSQESTGDTLTSSESKDSCEFTIEGSSVSHLSDGCRLSCSEDSDILDEISPTTEKPKSQEFEIAKLVSIKHKVKPTDEKPSAATTPRLRSPVVCVLGHVDTGKTKILDYIRKTHVGDNEAGHITQQIGATMIPQEALKEKCKMVRDFHSMDLNVPGLLVIDTPGHESFSNLRSRGSSICDIAVLVVDIMHGLEPQTIESINLLKKRKTPFIVALNKIDRLYGWVSGKDQDVEDVVKNQNATTQQEFRKKCREIILQFATQSLNAVLYYENEDPRSYVSMVPTSAITGDGMGNIMSVIVQLSQHMMTKKLIFSEELQATVLEVKVSPGMGTTIDVILVNGRLKEGDTIVTAGHDEPIVTQIRSLLMPQPLRELRVKNPYKEYKILEGAQGVKVIGKDLDKVIAGLPLFVVDNNHKVEKLKGEISSMLQETIKSFKLSERGVYVQASTLGSLEALLEFLRSSSIPFSGVKVGPVVKKDVMKASVMLEHDSQYAAILAFDVKIERDAQEIADNVGVRIFHADIIYHLFDMFIDYREELRKKKKMEVNSKAVFPCKLKILPHCVFSDRDPIVIGVSVEAGTLKLGTPLCVPSQDNSLAIGTVTNIEVNHKQIECAKKGQDVCVKIESKPGESPKTYGKHFSESDVVVSRISRQSIDLCKEHFRDDFQPSDWQLVIELKKLLHIL